MGGRARRRDETREQGGLTSASESLLAPNAHYGKCRAHDERSLLPVSSALSATTGYPY